MQIVKVQSFVVPLNSQSKPDLIDRFQLTNRVDRVDFQADSDGQGVLAIQRSWLIFFFVLLVWNSADFTLVFVTLVRAIHLVVTPFGQGQAASIIRAGELLFWVALQSINKMNNWSRTNNF